MDDLNADELDMSRVPGMQAAHRRLARLGVETVDLTHCDHGFGCEASVQVGRAERTFTVHGASDPVAAVDELADRVERARSARHGPRRSRR